MSRSIAFALISIGLLSACSDDPMAPPHAPIFGTANSESVGFTGVGNEPF